MTISNDARIERATSVLSSDLEGATVMMDIEGGDYYELRDTGARIWALLETPKTPDELCAILTREFRVDQAVCMDHIQEFIGKLSGLQLVEIS